VFHVTGVQTCALTIYARGVGWVVLLCPGWPVRRDERCVGHNGRPTPGGQMGIAFKSSERATLGVEWELQLVDRSSRHLRQEAQQDRRSVVKGTGKGLA